MIRTLMTGLAALAICSGTASTSAFAQPGGGKGNEHKGGGNDSRGGGPSGKPAKLQSNGQAASGHSANGKSIAPAQGRGEPRKLTSDRGNAADRGGPPAKAKNANASQNARVQERSDTKAKQGRVEPAQRAADRIETRDRIRDRVDRAETRPFRWTEARDRGLINGCPPGLAKKNNGCMPPGLVKNDPWQNVIARPDWWGYRDWRDGRARYYDGYLLRYNGDRIASYVPLLGGALSLGGLWPEYYQPVVLPPYYQDFYGLGPSYRYADNVLYRVDPETQAINSIAALLTGDDIVVGQPLPAYYGVYNVPYSYRDRYVDGPDALYRYSDGYVYRVDPTTRLVQAAIELLL